MLPVDKLLNYLYFCSKKYNKLVTISCHTADHSKMKKNLSNISMPRYFAKLSSVWLKIGVLVENCFSFSLLLLWDAHARTDLIPKMRCNWERMGVEIGYCQFYWIWKILSVARLQWSQAFNESIQESIGSISSFNGRAKKKIEMKKMYKNEGSSKSKLYRSHKLQSQISFCSLRRCCWSVFRFHLCVYVCVCIGLYVFFSFSMIYLKLEPKKTQLPIVW